MTDVSAQNPVSKAVRGGALDALRFVAALFVVVFHFGDEAPVALETMHGFLGRGYLATDFFLMLSGFVLAKAYGAAVASGKVSLGRFWSKRFVRCYPTHIITLAALAAMVALGALMGFNADNAGRFDWSGLPAQVFLLHAFGVGGGHWNIPSWTISTLLICYAFFPALWRAMLRIQQPAAALALGLAILVGADLLSLQFLSTEQFDLPFQWSMFRAAPLFLVGLTLARAIQTARMTAGQARLLGFGGGAVLLANALMVGPDMINILAICTIIMGCGASPATRAIPGAAWGARVSFCLFMVHTLTGAVWFDVVEPLAARIHPAVETVAWEGWVMWLGSLAVTLVAAAVYDRWIDAPIQRVLNARLFGPRAATPRPAPHPAPAPSA
ncbi:MAG: acyltransferase [Pseudomonadota bacterium]